MSEPEYEALLAANRAFALLERWIGSGMITGHRAKVLNALGDAPQKVSAALALAKGGKS